MISRYTYAQRAFAYALTCVLTWGQLSAAAYAAPTDIADIPMATNGRAKPNMILVVDESGSMDFEFLPQKGFSTNDGAAWWNYEDRSFTSRDINNFKVLTAGDNTSTPKLPPTGPINFNPSGSTARFWDNNGTAPADNRTWYKYYYLYPNGVCSTNPCDVRSYEDNSTNGMAVPNTREFAWFRSHLYNSQYYNPAINYDPWRPLNDGTTTHTFKNYDNTSSGLPWTAVRSHPLFPTPTTTGSTVDLTNTVPHPGDSAAANRTFRFYPGMILPAGARYRICDQNDSDQCRTTSGGTPAWQNNDGNERCVMVGTEAINNATCPNANAYNVTNTINNIGYGPECNDNDDTCAYIEAQVAYFPATYWIASTGTGALAADEAWGPDSTAPYAAVRLKRVEIKPTTTSYPKAITRNDCAGATCTYAEEMTNFANWWGYYRKRHMMMNGALGLALDQTRGMRVGAHTFNSPQPVTMYDLDNTNDALNGRRVMGLVASWKNPNGTPTRSALSYAGEQFRRTDSGAPITAACQYNAAFVITDGFANGSSPSITYGNVDAEANNRFNISYSTTDPRLNLTTATPAGTLPPPPATLPPVSVTPSSPFVDSFPETMGDIAMFYYSRNLRPDLTARQVPVDGNDTAPDADRNDTLHMNTFALGLGVTGAMFGRSDNADLIRWNQNPHDTIAPMLSWGTTNTTTLLRDPRTIDELWHATINGRGQMLSASSPEDTRSAINDIVNNIGAKGGAGAAVAVSNPNVIAGDNFSYRSSYNSGAWSGDINKYAIDLTTANISTTPMWDPSPQKQLANRDPNTRVIVTFTGSAGVPFRWTDITSTQQGNLSNDTLMLDFLRGDRAKEVEKFRSRGPRIVAPATAWPNNVTPNNIAVLGDMINAEPVIVGPPLRSYFDDGYGAYKAANASRSGVIYQGANDGMLHAFSTATGAELWAYVPSHLFPTLANLSSRSGFAHKYYVDGTPRAQDVDFGNVGGTVSSPDWRTILVGGLRKGGMGYYALDVTSPAAGTETVLASKVLWEFPNASTPSTTRAKIGYSYTRPIIAKTRAAGWVVIVASGYNNGSAAFPNGTGTGDGKGYIWVLNARTGAIIKEITTTEGSATDPSGLAYLTSFANRPSIDPTIEAVYGGDLLGWLYRFDFSGATTADWKVVKITRLTDASGNYQPINSEPELGMVDEQRMVFVGTGQYLGDKDVPGSTSPNTFATRKMSFFGIKDDVSFSTAGPQFTGRGSLVLQSITKGTTTASVTSNAVPNTAKGWVIDFTEDGERVFVRPVLSGGALVFPTTIPVGGAGNSCIAGGRSWLWFLDYATGGSITGSTIPTGAFAGSTGITSARVVMLPNGNRHAIFNRWDLGAETDGNSTICPPGQPTCSSQPLPSGSSGGAKRLTWREVPQQ